MGLYQRGNVWWIKYYRHGKSFRESSKSPKKMVAKKLLERREGEISQGKMPGILFEKVIFDELADELRRRHFKCGAFRDAAAEPLVEERRAGGGLQARV